MQTLTMPKRNSSQARDAVVLNGVIPEASPTNSSPKTLSLFKKQRIGSFEICFEKDGEAIKAKKSDGFVSLKPKGAPAQSQHFILYTEGVMPLKKVLLREIEAFYSRSSDYKLQQVHVAVRPR